MLSVWAPDASLIPKASTIGMSSERKNFFTSGDSGAAAVTNVEHLSRPNDSWTLLNTMDLAILYPNDCPCCLQEDSRLERVIIKLSDDYNNEIDDQAMKLMRRTMKLY